jgi:retron-type reverse transcriptase
MRIYPRDIKIAGLFKQRNIDQLLYAIKVLMKRVNQVKTLIIVLFADEP